MLGFLFFVGIIALIVYLIAKFSGSSSSNRQGAVYSEKPFTKTPKNRQSFEEQLATYYLSLDSPRDKSVIIRFANSAGIDLDNPRPLIEIGSLPPQVIKKQAVAAAQIQAEVPAVSAYVEQPADVLVDQPYAPPAPPIDNANYLLFMGAALIVVALLFFANAASSTFGTSVRFIALLASSAILFGIGLWIYKAKEALKPVGATFVWITLLSVPAIGFSLYHDVLGSGGAQWAWFITSIIGLIYIGCTYIFMKDNKYLEYIIYAASLNMLLATVATVSTQVKIFSVAGLVYAAALLILYKLKIVGKEKELPISISFFIAVASSILFLVQSLTNFNPHTAAWLGVYGLALVAYLQLIIVIYTERLSQDSLYFARYFQVVTVAWSLSFIGAGLTGSFSSLACYLPAAITGLGATAVGVRKSLPIGALYASLISGGTLIFTSLSVAPNKYIGAVFILLFGALLLVIANLREESAIPYAGFAALVTGGMLLNKAGDYNELSVALTLCALVGFAIATVQVLLQEKNRASFAMSGIILWTLATATQGINMHTVAVGLLFALGAAVLFVWQSKFTDVYLISGSLLLSVAAPLVGLFEAHGWLMALVSSAVVLGSWLFYTRFVPKKDEEAWFTLYGISIVVLAVIASLAVTAYDGWPIVLGLVPITIGVMYCTRTYTESFRASFAVMGVVLLLGGSALLGATVFTSASAVITAVLVEAICVHVLLLPFALALQGRVPIGQRISTYARVTTIAAILLLAFAPTLSNDLSNPLIYSFIALAGLCSVMSEGFLQNQAKYRYGGSAIAMLGVLQIMHEAGITNPHIFTHAIALYLVGLAVIVQRYRKRKDIVDNLLLGAVLVVLLPLSIDAFAGSSPASLALLIEAFIIMLVSALFRQKPLVIASGSILGLSILYRASSFLAHIPVWVWYLLVGVGLIAGAAYMLQKSGKQK